MSTKSPSENKKRLIIALTGASGAIYGIRALQALQAADDIETHLVISPSAQCTIAEETDMAVEDIKALADQVHSFKDIGASLSSGSYQTLGMLIAPCSVKTLSGIANCYDDNLIVRAADVCLKERRRLVLVPRETPLHAIHLENMASLARLGAIILPPEPAFYLRPESVGDVVDFVAERVLVALGLTDALPQRMRYQRRTE